MLMSRSRRRTPWRTPALFREAVQQDRQDRADRHAAPQHAELSEGGEYIKSGKFGDIVMVEMTLEREPARPLAAARCGAAAEGSRTRTGSAT